MAWDYKRNESAGFETDIAEGKHRIRIASAEKAVSKTGKLTVNALQAFRITNGVRTTIKGTAEGIYSLYLADLFLGIVTVENEVVKPEKILVQVQKPDPD